MSKFIDKTHLKMLLESLVLSKLYYLIIVWGECSKSVLKSVTKIFKRAREMLIGKYPTIEEKESLFWLDPLGQYNYELCIFAFQCKHNMCPKIFTNMLDSSLIIKKTTRNSTLESIDKDKCKSHLQFVINDSWIKLPKEIQNIERPNHFKKELKRYIFNINNVNQKDPDMCDLACIDEVINHVLNRNLSN